MGFIVAVEGGSFCGKSFVCGRAAALGFRAVGDPATFSHLHGGFVRADCVEGAVRNINTTLEIERTRADRVRSELGQGCNVVLDRSVFSLLALSYAYLNGEHSDIYKDIVQRVGQAVLDNRFVLPTHLVLLSEDLETLRSRMRERENNFPSFWLDESFVAAQYKVYHEVAKVYAKFGGLIDVDTLLNLKHALKPSCVELSEVMKAIGYCK